MYQIYLSPPHMSGEEQRYIQQAFQTNWIAPVGPNIDRFEQEVALYVRAKGAVAVSSGTAAIHLALSLLEVKKGDRVFCSTLTFVASANPILYQGAEPVFIDSEPDTWNMSPRALERALKEAVQINQLPKAVIVVHLYGQSARMNEIMELCQKYKVPVIEDAAESLGSTYRGQYTGTFGDFGIYSFNGNKIITTSGGGMLVSNNEEALNKAKFLATQARDSAIHYEHSTMGYNYRMSNILAGIGLAQLNVLQKRIEARREVFQRYYKRLSHINGVAFMPELRETITNRWLTALTIDCDKLNLKPKEIINVLKKNKIEARPVWKPLHLQSLFKGCLYYSHSEVEHIAETLFYTGVCLPSGSNLSVDEQTAVIKLLQTSMMTSSHSIV
ncbi:aminotransferase class I/II-fold pyridoxal phosphate-dependent enzyme [Priestia flexa]|uniref:aminotransferase class I/II-fold pyridoxal phosphate-dependent enzyme n=1 Tax=Priestia flexa TaxID=86664 RepID=UPI002492F67D|nr:aminotransferase class I/II-fold pyridoxal phosphate-dependent enzyme [Priestia flexa]